ncbi:MAG: hypothetical protein GXP53_11260 [Deltaproteobacteria bacterium]|nr:hypothetical protein [Deltaproteobacteria bacterium]
MQKILVSLPDQLANRMKAILPNKQRSKIIAGILEREIVRREKDLYQCALEVEADRDLNDEMKDWNITTGDGIEPEPW